LGYLVINEARAPIANPPNSAQPEGTPYHSPSYIWIRAVVSVCSEGQTDIHTDRQTHRHTHTHTQMRVTNTLTPHEMQLFFKSVF